MKRILRVYPTHGLRDHELQSFGIHDPTAVISGLRNTATMPDGSIIQFHEAHDMRFNRRIHGLEFNEVYVHPHVDEESRVYAKSRERIKS